MSKNLLLVLITSLILVACGGGSSYDNTPSNSPIIINSVPALFNPKIELGGIQCQCASCIAGIVATSSSPIAGIGFSVDTTYAPAANSANWIPVNGATNISNNYQFSAPVSMNCTAYSNSQICVFAKSVDGQVAGGSCSSVRRIY
jgi:hypothetical protein